MDNIIDLRDQFALPRDLGEPDPLHDKFLVTEGLDVLASYKAIKDPIVRAGLRSLLAALAKNEGPSAS